MLTCFSTVFLGHLQTFPAEVSCFPASAVFSLIQGLHFSGTSFNTLQLSQRPQWKGVCIVLMSPLPLEPFHKPSSSYQGDKL